MNHMVRIVNATVDRLDDSLFIEAYPGGGRNSYHPKMKTKIVVYAYMQRIYSSRQIAKAVRVSGTGPKVSLEVGWIALAHNLLKKAAVDQEMQKVG